MVASSPSPAPQKDTPALTSVAFDWIDLLIFVVVGYGAAFALHGLGVQLEGSRLGFKLAPIVVGALMLRRKVFPAPRRVVKRGLSFLGLLATGFMVAGVAVTAFGGVVLYGALAGAMDPVSESEVEERVERQAELARLPHAEVRESPEHAGGFDELMKALNEAPAMAVEDRARLAAEVRGELEAEARESFAQRRREGMARSLWLGGFGLLLLVAGGLIDARRELRVAEA